MFKLKKKTSLFSMLYRIEANSRDRQSNIEKGEGDSIVEMRKEIRLNPLTPVRPVTVRDELWPFFHF